MREIGSETAALAELRAQLAALERALAGLVEVVHAYEDDLLPRLRRQLADLERRLQVLERQVERQSDFFIEVTDKLALRLSRLERR